MDANKMIGMVVGVMVGVLILSAALFPVIDSATTTERTFDNTNISISDMKTFEVGDTWSRDSVTGEWSLNGDAVSNLNQGAYSAIMTETLAGRSNGQFRGVTATGNVAGIGAVVVDETTITLSGSGLQGSATQAYAQGFGITDKGDYVLTKYLSDRNDAYLLDTTEIYATGTTAGSTVVNTVVHIEGTIKDGVTVTASPLYNTNTNKTVTVGDVNIDCEKVNGYVNLYKFKQITFTITETDTSTDTTETVNASYSALVIPKVITAELAVHASQDEIEILETIPILITVGLILGIVGTIFVRRLE